MMKKRLIIATVASLAVATAIFAGQPMMDGSGANNCDNQMSKSCDHKKHCKKGDYKKGHHRAKLFFKKIFKELDLTYAQKSQIKDIVKESRKGSREDRKSHRRGDFRRDMPDMSTFMSADKFDKDGFKKAMIEKKAKRDEMRQKRRDTRLEKRADTMEKIFAILTPKQRTELIKLSQEK